MRHKALARRVARATEEDTKEMKRVEAEAHDAPTLALAAKIDLLADSQPRDDGYVALRIDAPHIVQQAAATANQRQKSAATCVVLHVNPHVLGQAVDPRGQNGNLHLR